MKEKNSDSVMSVYDCVVEAYRNGYSGSTDSLSYNESLALNATSISNITNSTSSDEEDVEIDTEYGNEDEDDIATLSESGDMPAYYDATTDYYFPGATTWSKKGAKHLVSISASAGVLLVLVFSQ